MGRSQMAQRYAISSRSEAEAYLTHSTLGSRLRECTEMVNAVEGRSANDIFGSPDDLKFRSSMTLFDAVADDPTPFRTALKLYYDNEPDSKTLELLEKAWTACKPSRSTGGSVSVSIAALNCAEALWCARRSKHSA